MDVWENANGKDAMVSDTTGVTATQVENQEELAFTKAVNLKTSYQRVGSLSSAVVDEYCIGGDLANAEGPQGAVHVRQRAHCLEGCDVPVPSSEVPPRQDPSSAATPPTTLHVADWLRDREPVAVERRLSWDSSCFQLSEDDTAPSCASDVDPHSSSSGAAGSGDVEFSLGETVNLRGLAVLSSLSELSKSSRQQVLLPLKNLFEELSSASGTLSGSDIRIFFSRHSKLGSHPKVKRIMAVGLSPLDVRPLSFKTFISVHRPLLDLLACESVSTLTNPNTYRKLCECAGQKQNPMVNSPDFVGSR